MKINVFARIAGAENTGYIQVKQIIHAHNMETAYNRYRQLSLEFGDKQCESFEGYKLAFIPLEVEFDGRSKKVTDNDVKRSLAKNGLAHAINMEQGSIVSYYLPTEKLLQLLEDSYNKRKELITHGIYETLQAAM